MFIFRKRGILMFTKLENATEKILSSEKLSKELKEKTTIDDVISFYQSVDSSLSEGEILDYFCEVFGLEEDVVNIEDVLDHVSGGGSNAASKLLASTLGALTMTTSMGGSAKGLNNVKINLTSASQTVKGGFKKFGSTVKDRWNGLSKKQKIAIAATVAATAVGLSIYGAVKHHKNKINQKQKIQPNNPEFLINRTINSQRFYTMILLPQIKRLRLVICLTNKTLFIKI